MCTNCGCVTGDVASSHDHPETVGVEGIKPIAVLENILDKNDRQAIANRSFFAENGAVAINLMSSPGSGKTRLLEASVEALGVESVGVIEGDLETENDAERIRAKGVEAYQITTGMACHLDAAMVAHGLEHLDIAARKYIFVENVGNLVCPANFDLGQTANVVLFSVTEGDDKPAKYPVMFEAADLVVVTKTDLLPHLEEFDMDRARAAVHLVNPKVPVLAVSAKTGAALSDWLDWLQRLAREAVV